MKVWKVNVTRKDASCSIFPAEKWLGNNIAETVLGNFGVPIVQLGERPKHQQRPKGGWEIPTKKTKRIRLCYPSNWRLIIKYTDTLLIGLLHKGHKGEANILGNIYKNFIRNSIYFLLLRSQRWAISRIRATRGVLKELSNISARIKKKK